MASETPKEKKPEKTNPIFDFSKERGELDEAAKKMEKMNLEEESKKNHEAQEKEKSLKGVDDSKRDFSKEIEQAVKRLKNASTHRKEDKWVSEGEISPKIDVFSEPTPAGRKSVCGTGLIEASPARVLSEVTNPASWKEWDPLLKTSQVKKLSDDLRIVYLQINSIWPYNERDIVYLEVSGKEEDGSMYAACCGISSADFPITDSYVRALLVNGGWYLKSVEGQPNQCLATYFMDMDPLLAYIPQWIMNMAATRFPGIINKVRDGIAIKDGKKKKEEGGWFSSFW